MPEDDKAGSADLPIETSIENLPNYSVGIGSQPASGFKVEKQTRITSGPIPRPEILAAYDELSPGLAKEIVSMAKEQAIHRQYIEKTAINADTYVAKVDVWERLIGQVFGFVIAVLAIVTGVYLITNGYEWPGTFIGASGVTGLAAVFVIGRKNKQVNENKSK